MSVIPRAMLLAALLVAAMSPLVLADSETCVTMRVQDYASGLRVIAETGSVIALGVMSGTPGDGLGYVLYITPAFCAGTGSLPLGSVGESDVQGVLDNLPELVPLP